MIALLIPRFQSTLPARGATLTGTPDSRAFLFQSTLPARGATKRHPQKPSKRSISIHAPRTGSDERTVDYSRSGTISIHAPRTGSDVTDSRNTVNPNISIHAPRTGSDTAHTTSISGLNDFNPRSPHGERHLDSRVDTLEQSGFQSTLPARGATFWEPFARNNILFQSTLPARGATTAGSSSATSKDISIHAPRTGSDCFGARRRF